MRQEDLTQMKHSILRSMVAVATLAPAVACAETAPIDFYVRGDVGASTRNNSDVSINDDGKISVHNHRGGTSPVFGFGAGAQVLPFLRMDATFSYRPSDNAAFADTPAVLGAKMTTKDDVRGYVGLINVYYDFRLSASFIPYIATGIGAASNKVRDISSSVNGATVALTNNETDTQFAWQVGGGVAYVLGPHVALDLSFRDLHPGRIRATGSGMDTERPVIFTVSQSLRVQEFQLGVRVQWP
jgi:opacity protein-like surface antigen